MLLIKSKLLLQTTALLIVLLIGGCKKTAGEGGNSIIKGNVWVEDWNSSFNVKNGEYAGYDEDVYILYGDAVSYSEKTKANYNGEYEFKYLRPGNYKIYVYSKDKTLQSKSGDVVILKEMEIKKKKEIVTVEQITIYK